MLPEIGHSALVFALLLAFIAACAPVFSQIVIKRSQAQIAFVVIRLVRTQFVLISLSFVMLALSFLNNDFSVAYVAQHSNMLLPVYYKFSAVWGGHEGSLLLWLWILALWIFLLSLNRQDIPSSSLANVLAVTSVISFGFLAFILFTSNPFDRLVPVFPMDGEDLNPLLQDFGLIIHPPMLYMGYVGFSIPFAFAIAGLIEGRFDAKWAKWSGVWAKAAWAFLTVGIALGSWWAYYELGWGGWWFWDPVENASLMPWLAGAALIHSLLACEKRDGFRIWTVLIAIITFSLSLLGTFLVRSGVLTSVHAFASDPERGLFILVFLALVVGASFLLFFVRAERLQSELDFGFLSKEFFLILNNIFLLVACATVLLGTLFPIFSDVLNLGKISVGPPYFNTLFFPLCLLLLLFMAWVPLLKWRETSRWPVKLMVMALAGSLIAASLFMQVFAESWYLKAWLALIFIFAVLAMLFANHLQTGLAHVFSHWQQQSLSQKNMHIAHFGFVVSLVGIVMTSSFSTERDLSLKLGGSVDISGYRFTFEGIEPVRGPNYLSTRGTILVEQGKTAFRLYPEKRRYFIQDKPMTEAAIDAGLLRDVYVALGEDLGANAWSLRIYHKPFIRLIWLGALIMAGSCLFYIFVSARRGRA